MFFASEISLPFEGLREVIKAVPDWTLVYIEGYDAVFQIPASQGDADYMKYEKLLEKNLDKYRAANIEEGLKRIQTLDRTILHTSDAALRGAHTRNPSSFPAIRTFGASSTSYSYIVLTENSPLMPMFMQAITKSFETGQYDRIATFWQGQKISDLNQNFVDTMVLTPGQMFLSFGILLLALASAFLCFILEVLYSRSTIVNPNGMESQQNWLK